MTYPVDRMKLQVRAMAYLLLIAQMAQGQTGIGSWDQLAGLRPGVEIRMEVKGEPGKVNGKWVTADPNGVTIRMSDGTQRTIGRSSVAKVEASGGARRLAPVYGAGAGAAVAGVVASQRRFDLVSSAVVVAIAAGSIVGYLVGRGVRYRIVYQVP